MHVIVETILSFLLLYWGVSLVASSMFGTNYRTAIFQRALAAVVLFVFVLLLQL